MLLVAGYSAEGYRPLFARHVQAVKEHGFARGEYPAKRKDGTLIEVETRSSGMSFGGRFCLIIVGQDITARKRAEQALQQSEETLRTFLNALPEPALLMDRDGTLLVSNQAFARTLALPAGELIGKDVFSLFPPKIAKRGRLSLTRSSAPGSRCSSRTTRDGRHLMNFVSPVLDPAGNVTRVAVFALDITERKQAESALASQEALYRTLFELSPDGILLEDDNGNILDANQALCRSFGYTREELLHQNVRWFVPAGWPGRGGAAPGPLRAGQTLEHEVWNIRKNGQRCLMRLNEKPLPLPDGRQGILVVARDITESKRARVDQASLSVPGREAQRGENASGGGPGRLCRRRPALAMGHVPP